MLFAKEIVSLHHDNIISSPRHFSERATAKPVRYILPKLARRLGMIMNSPASRRFLALTLPGCRETDRPVAAAEARIREFSS